MCQTLSQTLMWLRVLISTCDCEDTNLSKVMAMVGENFNSYCTPKPYATKWDSGLYVLWNMEDDLLFSNYHGSSSKTLPVEH